MNLRIAVKVWTVASTVTRSGCMHRQSTVREAIRVMTRYVRKAP